MIFPKKKLIRKQFFFSISIPVYWHGLFKKYNTSYKFKESKVTSIPTSEKLDFPQKTGKAGSINGKVFLPPGTFVSLFCGSTFLIFRLNFPNFPDELS